MSKLPFVSVQVINWNGKKFLKGCFDSLLKQDYKNFELVLVDNGSSDGSEELVRKNYSKQILGKKIRIVSFDKNYGFAEAYNRAYQQTNADYILLINNDTLAPKKNLLSLLVKKAESDKKTSCVGAAIYPLGTDLENAKDQKPGTLSIVLTNTLRTLEKNSAFYVSGCCCLIKKKLIDTPFDEDYFAYSEDVYLGWKSNLQGYKNVFEPKARILHYGSGTSGTGSPFIRYYGERNRVLNCLLFYELRNLERILPLMTLYSLVSGIFLIQRPKVFAAHLKAHLWILFHPLTILKKRREIQKLRKVSDEKILSLLSTDIFLVEPKATSFYGSMKKNRFMMDFAVKTGNFLNKMARAYAHFIGIKAL